VTHTPRFGVITLQTVPWPAQIERWRYLEALGFDHAWLADHFANSSRPTQSWFEAWMLLAGLATQTTRIRCCPKRLGITRNGWVRTVF